MKINTSLTLILYTDAANNYFNKVSFALAFLRFFED